MHLTKATYAPIIWRRNMGGAWLGTGTNEGEYLITEDGGSFITTAPLPTGDVISVVFGSLASARRFCAAINRAEVFTCPDEANDPDDSGGRPEDLKPLRLDSLLD